MTEIVGYFAWTRYNGRAQCEKYHKDRDNMNSEATADFESRTLAKHPLTASEWQLSLDNLARLYPCPQ